MTGFDFDSRAAALYDLSANHLMPPRYKAVTAHLQQVASHRRRGTLFYAVRLRLTDVYPIQLVPSRRKRTPRSRRRRPRRRRKLQRRRTLHKLRRRIQLLKLKRRRQVLRLQRRTPRRHTRGPTRSPALGALKRRSQGRRLLQRRRLPRHLRRSRLGLPSAQAPLTALLFHHHHHHLPLILSSILDLRASDTW